MIAGRGNRRGNALVEFALSFGVLFAAFAGVFQFGYTYYVYDTLVSVVRGGARYASVLVYDSPNSTPSSAYLTAVRNMVVYGNPSGGGQAAAPGLTPENVSVTVDMEKNVPARITVAISNYTVVTGLQSFTLADKPKITFPFTGRFTP